MRPPNCPARSRRGPGARTDSPPSPYAHFAYGAFTVSGSATYTGIPDGTYRDAVTGDTRTVSDGRLTVGAPGKGNLRVYVLNGPGKIGKDGPYLK